MTTIKPLTLFIIFLFIFILSVVPGETLNTPFHMISAGGLHSVLLSNNGTVWAWGFDMQGQCGDKQVSNDTIMQLAPVKAEISDIKSVSAGDAFTIALKDDGTVWAWGANTFGQLGTAINGFHPIPAKISGLSNITMISAGSDFALALKDDGTVWAWGSNRDGQLGDGIPYNRSFSTNTYDGYYQSLTTNQNLTSQSVNNNDQSEDTWYTAHNSTPGIVYGLSGIKFVSTNGNSALAVDDNGIIWAWGNYRLNYSTLNGFSTPTKFGVLTNITAISRNGFLTSDGNVWILTFNSTKLDKAPLKVPYDLTIVSSLTNITAIAVGNGHYVALKDDGTIWTWGNNDLGQLGDGTNKSRPTPNKLNGLHNMSYITAGPSYTIAVSDDGTIWGWGSDSCGQLGNGESGDELYKKSPVVANFMSNMGPNKIQVTPIADIDGLSASSQNNYQVMGIIIIILLIFGGLLLLIKGRM
jgi:alpha-tubulin suppressor-like RCC1 family protein